MRKAQVQMGETFAVLVVFFILLAMGLVFYGAIQKSGIKEQQEEHTDKLAIQLAHSASFLPEIQCSFAEVVKENCFDLYKLLALNETVLQDDDSYLRYWMLFGNSKIEIVEVYPNPRNWLIYNATLEEEQSYPTVISTFIPVTLLNVSVRPEINTFGYLNVTLYG